MRKLFSKSLSVILAASLAFTSVNLTSMAKETSDEDAEILISDEEQELKEDLRTAVSDDKHPGGVFGFYKTILNANEGDELAVSVVRQGNTDDEATVLFKAVDISAEYKKDYTLSVEAGLFGDKDLTAADGVRPLMEEYGEIATKEDVEAIMETEDPLQDAAIEDEEATEEEIVIQDAETEDSDIENQKAQQEDDEIIIQDDATETKESAEDDIDIQEAAPEEEEIDITSEDEEDEIPVEDNKENSDDAPQYVGGTNSLADIYSLQTGEEAPERDWTEYTTEEVSQETADTMRAGWDDSRENLEALEGVSVRLTFAPGEYKKDIKIKVKDDSKSESDEIVLFVLQDAENAEVGDSYNGYLNISDNDSHEELIYSVVEKNIIVTPDQDIATVTVRRNSGIDQMDFVSVGTLGIDAQPSVDYIAINEELFFAAGITERTVEIPIISERTKDTNFWVGVTSKSGTVTEDNACLVTIQKITDEEDIIIENDENRDVFPEGVEYTEDDVELTDISNDGAAPKVEVTVYEPKDGFTGLARGGNYTVLPQRLDITAADYVIVEYITRGYTKRPWWRNDDREKEVTIWFEDENGKDIKSPHTRFYQAPRSDPGKADSGNAYFTRMENEKWDFKNARIAFRVVGKTGTRNEDVAVQITKVIIGYTQYKLELIPEFNHMDQYEEKQYTGSTTSDKGSTATYPKVYLTNGNKNYTEVTALSGTVFGVAKEAKGEKPNSQGVYATEETTNFLGFKLIPPGGGRELSPLISGTELRLNNDFKIKYKEFIYDNGTIQLVPIFEPKKVVVNFNNDKAKVSDKADAKGCYDGFTSGAKLEATMLDSLKVRAKANEGYGITGMAIQKLYGVNRNAFPRGRDYTNISYQYAEVANNIKTDMPNVLVVPLNYGAAEPGIPLSGIVNLNYTDLRVVINYDKASITLAPSPQSKNNAKNGSILYVEGAITGDDKDKGKVAMGGETIKIEGTSINKGYTFGSVPADGYHAFWKDGTLDYDGDGIVNDTNPFYKSFQNSYGNSFRYMTQLPLSKIYYNFVKGVDMQAEEEDVPIRGWLVLRDRLLISGTLIQQGINNIDVYCDGVETRTKNGGFGGRNGDGYFELTSDNFYDLFTYAVTFSGSCEYGDVATMSVQNPGTNKDILVDTWNDVTVSDVHLFQSVEKKDKKGYEYEKIDTSAVKSGYFTGLTDGDYDYRIQMTAHRDGINITRAELAFYNDKGMPVSVEGKQDENNAGIFTFDFNPKKLNIKAGAKAKVTFYAGTTRFLSRDVGIEIRAGLGMVNIANFLAGGDAGVAIDIIGAVNTAIDMGWSGDVDKVTVKGDVYLDEEQNKVVKVGIGANVIKKESKDKYNEATKGAAKAAKEVGKLNSKIAKLEGKIESATGEEKKILQGELISTKMDLEKAKEKNTEAKGKLDETLEGMTKPKKNSPKFGQKFTMDLGFSFLVTFSHDDDVKKWYFKNMMLTATLGAAYEVTMNYATPIGITIGIGLKLELNGSASFVVEQRHGFEDNKNYRYYINDNNKDNLKLLDVDGEDPHRMLDKYGLFSVNPAITLTLSAGIAGDLLKVAVSGKAAFSMVFGTDSDSAGSCTLSASIKITALIFSFKKELANKTYKLWGDPDVKKLGDVYSAQILQAMSDAGDSYLYESIDAFEAEDVSYLAAGTDWYGGAEDSEGRYTAIDEGGEDAYKESLLADKIAAHPEFNVVSLGNGKLAAVFLNAPVKRTEDANNSKAAYYTYFDGNSWSDPLMIEDDETLDQYPRIYSLGAKGAFIIWSSVCKDYKDTEDKLERQNALDIHGRFVSPDGSLSEKIEEITKTTLDPKGKATGIEISDFAADRAFGVFSDEEKLVVCYEKRQYAKGSDDTAQVGDMMYPVSTVIASRTYDFAKGEWAEGNESLESLPGLAALRADVAKERIATYNANVYGQKFFDYLPKVLLLEDMEEHSGYYREGGNKATAVKFGENEKGFLLDTDATVIKSGGKELGVVAYTVDTDGDLKTPSDRELYLATYDMATDKFSEPIILTGYEIYTDSGDAQRPASSSPIFVETNSALFLTWIKNENILALNVSNIIDNEDVLVKTGTVDEVSYRYIDKTFPDDSSKVGYQAPFSLVAGRISKDAEDANVTGDIHEFDAETDGKYIYVVWPEAADDRPQDAGNGLTDVQMWCARSEATTDEAGAKLIDITKPVQITSAYDNHYDDVAFGVNDGKIYGVARKIPSRLITAEEAKEIYGEKYDEATFVHYAIWDDKAAYPVSFYVDPGSVARIKNGDFTDAVAGEGAYFSFDILNDGFDTLEDAKVSAKDSQGNELLGEEDITLSGLVGGDATSVAGCLPLDLSAKEAVVYVTVTEKNGDTDDYVIYRQLEEKLNIYNLTVSSIDERGVYRVRGVVENSGNATSESGTLKFFSKKGDTNRVIERVSYPELAPGESYDIDTYIIVSDEDFTVTVQYVDKKTGKIVDTDVDLETTSPMVTEELKLYASYVDEDDETVEMPVYEEDCDVETEEFIKRVAYPSEMEYIEAVTGVVVKAVKEVTDEKGNVTGKTVSIGKGLISLEKGEKVSLLTSIESSLAGRKAAVDDEGDVLITSTGTENLTYRYDFEGDAAEFDESGRFVALNPGSGKLTVYVYPADRKFKADNYIRMPGDTLEEQYAFSQMDEGDYINTFDDFPAYAIKIFTVDVEVLPEGERIDDADTNIFEDAKGIYYRKSGKSEVAVCGVNKDKKITNLTIPATVKKDGTTYKVTRIDANSFKNNSVLKSVTIGKNVTNIRSCAFEECNSLTSVKFGANVVEIGDEAFMGCIALKNLKLPSKLEKINARAFMNCSSITSVTIPSKVSYIGEKAFFGCNKLKSVTIKTDKLNVSTLGRDAFGAISKDAVFKLSMKSEAAKKIISDILTDEAEVFSDKKGIVYKVLSEDTRILLVEGLSEDAAKKLKTLTIPATINYKGAKYTVVTVGAKAFEGNAKLTKVTLPKTLTSIKERAFADVTGLKSIVIPAAVTKIGKEAFSGCTALNKVTIAGRPVEIGKDAFDKVPDKATFKITTKDKEAYNRIVMSLIVYTDTLTDSRNYNYKLDFDEDIELGLAGINDNKAKAIKVPDTVKFRGITIPVTVIGEKAFKGNTAITSVTLGKNVRSVEENAFEGCTSLGKVTIKNTGFIMERAFAGCTSLKTLKLSNSTEFIGVGAFADCTALKNLTITAEVRTIDDEAFAGCKSLKTVTIKSKCLILVGYNAFYGNSAAATYKISDKKKLEAYKQLLIDAGVDKGKIK